MASTATPSVDVATLRRVIVAASIGNFVEWFDFAAYGVLATLLAQKFFPSSDATAGLLKAFALYAVAFAFRPLGGVVFGIIGDRIGRKRTLALTILLMAGATALIGLLPTYAAVGTLAPVLLALLRCVQGFSAGGEYAGACAYVMEHAPQHQRGRYGAFISVSTFVSFAVAAMVAAGLAALLSPEAMSGWGWRVPFLAAAPVGLVGLYLRASLGETPAFQALENTQTVAHAPLRETLRTQGGTILRLGAFISVTALSFYTFTTYLITYTQKVGGMNLATSLQVNVISLLIAAVLCPIAGLFADWAGRRRTIMVACLLIMAVVFPSFTLAKSGSFGGAVAGAALLAVGALLTNVVTAPLLSEVFPTKTRYTASAIAYNLAYTIFGGTAPFVATYLIDSLGDKLAPAYYLVAIAVLGLIGGLLLPETGRLSLHDSKA